MRLTKTLISGAAAVAVLGLVTVAAPAFADANSPYAAVATTSSAAAGSTAAMTFEFTNPSAVNIQNGTVPGSIAVFHAPTGVAFIDQPTVPVALSADGGKTFGATGMTATSCVVSAGGSTLTCNIGGASTPPGYIRKFSPQVTVDPSVAPGTVLTGSVDFTLWTTVGANPALWTTTTATSQLRAVGPGAPVYNDDTSVDIPGFGTRGRRSPSPTAPGSSSEPQPSRRTAHTRFTSRTHPAVT